MKGELNVGTLPSATANNDGVSPVEAMHGKLNDRPRHEVGNLMHAAYIIEEFEHFPHLAIRHLDAINADNRGRLVKAWRAVAPDRDIPAELEQHRNDADAQGMENTPELDQMNQAWWSAADLDDMIPF